MRAIFYIISIVLLVLVGVIYPAWHGVLYWLIPVGLYILVGLADIHLSRSLILKNYPVIGHFRYFFEFIRPEIQQYFVATNLSGRPFNREQRNMVYRRAKNTRDTIPFGTQHDIDKVGYESCHHSMLPKECSEESMFVTIGGDQCKKPYRASRLNISGMSYGALSPTAVESLNRGAKLGGFAQNTGEGGLSRFHLAGGGDIFMQLGTGYFGCRTKDGHFDPVQFKEKSNLDVVTMIEIKISQGAKPATGGLLPGAKVSEPIAEARGVPVGKEVESPKRHSAFSTPIELLEFVQKLRELSGGKPVGFKFCLGRMVEFAAICKAMLKTGILPDFITVDGAEGGTGAAPVEYCDRLGMNINHAIAIVHGMLTGTGLRSKIKIIASGKVISGFDMVTKIALGADVCASARGMLLSLGCIQAVRCNTNTCPTGITTQDPKRYKVLKPKKRAQQVANFHNNTIKSFTNFVGAMGLQSVEQLSPFMLFREVSGDYKSSYGDIYAPIYLEEGELLKEGSVPEFYKHVWPEADPNTFHYTNPCDR